MGTSEINCLVSHKCNAATHAIALRLKRALQPFQISLQIDPFRVGDDSYARMQTFEIEALLFLCSPESPASEHCQLELDSAVRQGLPVFVAHLEGPVPKDLKRWSYWHVELDDDELFLAGVKAIATSVRARVHFHRKILLINDATYFHDMIAAAKSISLDGDRTIVAEYAVELAKRYAAVSDPTTRFNLALALGRADTKASAQLLEVLPPSGHPLEEEGKRQARDMMQNH